MVNLRDLVSKSKISPTASSLPVRDIAGEMEVTNRSAEPAVNEQKVVPVVPPTLQSNVQSNVAFVSPAPPSTEQPKAFDPASIQDLKNAFLLLSQHIDNPEQVGQALRRIMLQLAQHPQQVEFLAPEDFGLMIRAARKSYGIVLETVKKKREGKNKKETAFSLEDFGNINLDGL